MGHPVARLLIFWL